MMLGAAMRHRWAAIHEHAAPCRRAAIGPTGCCAHRHRRAEAVVSSYHVARFRVGHGCDCAPTRSPRIEIPEGVVTATPQPKLGWTIRIARAPLTTPIAGEGGRRIVDRVAAITWSGSIAWTNIPSAGQPWGSVPHPPPTIETIANTAAPRHH